MSGIRERRWHPLLDQWVIVAAASATRPWSGTVLDTGTDAGITHDPSCYLCPRVERANGELNSDFKGCWAFDNDFPSLAGIPAPASTTADSTTTDSPLRKQRHATGINRVLVWSERHNATLATLSESDMRQVVSLWASEYAHLSKLPDIDYVLIFENKGKETGVSNLHPHGQVYATGFITDTAHRLRQSQQQYAQAHQQELLQALIHRPEYSDELLVEKGQSFVTIVPYFARFAYETWIVPTRHVTAIDQLTDTELDELSGMYQRQAQRYDQLFHRPSPNITLLNNAPCDDSDANRHWCFYIGMQPPLRASDKLKYLAGFESGSNNIVNPVQPELAAQALRQCSTGTST